MRRYLKPSPTARAAALAASLLLSATMAAAGQDPRPVSVTPSLQEAGRKLRRAVRLSANDLVTLADDAQRTAAQVPSFASILGELRGEMVGAGGSGGLRAKLLEVDTELIHSLWALRTPAGSCQGAKLADWEKRIGAEQFHGGDLPRSSASPSPSDFHRRLGIERD